MRPDVTAIAKHFDLAGELIAAEPYHGGHINDSFLLTCRQADGTARYLVQRINEVVFRRPERVMSNIERVTGQIAAKLAAGGVTDAHRRTLALVRTRDGDAFHRDEAGSYWRVYPFIEETRVTEAVETPEQAYQAGRAFGAFQQFVADLPGPRLHETIPDFHNTPLRYAAFQRAVQSDPRDRVKAAEAEIEFAVNRRPLAGVLVDLQACGAIPERIVHNDTKISNVLFDVATGEALCVTDLDTVMPGVALCDFGDMVRSMTCTAAEDETDLAQVEVQMPLFEALARGYLETAGAFLNDVERAHLVTAGKLITLEQGVRFLTDFLNGDVYYKTQRPHHNLDRCRTQLKLVESIERHENELRRIVGRG